VGGPFHLGFWILDFRFSIFDFGLSILDFGFSIFDFRFWILDFGFSIFGFSILDRLRLGDGNSIALGQPINTRCDHAIQYGDRDWKSGVCDATAPSIFSFLNRVRS